MFSLAQERGDGGHGLPEHYKGDLTIIRDRLDPKTGMNMTRVHLFF